MSSVIYSANPWLLECIRCPTGCQYQEIDMCKSDCGTCDCDASAQGNCNCPQQ